MEKYAGPYTRFNRQDTAWGCATAIDRRDARRPQFYNYRMDFHDVEFYLDMVQKCTLLLGEGSVFRNGQWNRNPYINGNGWVNDIRRCKIYLENQRHLDMVLFEDRLAA